MSPADPTPIGAEDEGGDPPVAGWRRRVRCESCWEVLETRHAWDSVACRCGALALSGSPGRPRISWIGLPGGGWSDVTDTESDGEQPVETSSPPASHGYGAKLGDLRQRR